MSRGRDRLRPVAGPVSRVQWFLCLLRGHRWDPAPQRGTPALRCVRCGMTVEPFTPG